MNWQKLIPVGYVLALTAAPAALAQVNTIDPEVIDEGRKAVVDIITAAAVSTLGLLALMVLLLAALAAYFFRKGPVSAQMSSFVLMFGGVVAFGFAIQRESDNESRPGGIDEMVGIGPIETHFTRIPNAGLRGHNDLPPMRENVNPEDCMRLCIDEPRCRSFDYHKPERRCYLSTMSANDVGGLKYNYEGNPWDHYARH